MTPFEHLSVLFSIILGLGITHLLSNVHELFQARARVRVHWLPVTWAVLVFVSVVQWWWASFGMRGHAEWNFFWFLFVLLRPVIAYLTAAIVLPGAPSRAPRDLRAYYFDNRHTLFLLLAAGNVLDGIRRMISGESPLDLAVWSNFVSATMVGSLAATRREGYHAIVTVLTALLFAIFILDSALQLG